MSCLVDRDVGVRVPALAARSILPRGPAPARGARLVRGALPHGRAQQSLLSSAEPGRFDRWRLAVPDGFRFAVKANREITHFRRLRDCRGTGPAVPRARLAAGRQARPHSLPATAHPALRPGTAPGLPGGAPRRAAGSSSFAIRAGRPPRPTRRSGAPAWRSAYQSAAGSSPTSSPRRGFAYLRMHTGSGAGGAFPVEELLPWARRIRGLNSAGKDCYVYFNNDRGGHAPRDARRSARPRGLRA